MRRITIITSILLLSLLNIAHAYNPNGIKFHCQDDTLKLNKLLEKGYSMGNKSANSIISFYAEELLGVPYVAHTLEGEEEILTINIDELDCTTYVESVIALAQTTIDGRTNWRDYANHLENIRYKKGILNGYGSRLHYISDWIAENSARGNVKEITSDLPRFSYEIKTLDYMSSHRDSYKAMKDSINYEAIKKVEANYRSHRYPIIKKNGLGFKDMRTAFKDGDIIAITTKIEGLDISHMGIIKMVNGAPHLLNASSINKKTEICKDDLSDMLAKSKMSTGVRVFRLIKY